MERIKYSVIIPTLNQSQKLTQCLEHLALLSYDPSEFEVLVIDNGSTDDTQGVTESYQGRIRNLHCHYCAEPGLMAARHMGCDEANGEILCYLDDDSMVTEGWLRGMEESFHRDDVVIAGGPCIPKYEEPPPEWVENFWVLTDYGKVNTFLSLVDFGEDFRMIPPYYIFGCNYAIRKQILLEYGGTQPDYYPEKYRAYQGTGESALAQKLHRNGFFAAYNPRARIDHLIPSSRLTLKYFCWRRYFNGIHSSYQDVRRQHGLDGYVGPDDAPGASSGLSVRKIVQAVRRPLGRAKHRVAGFLRKGGFFAAAAQEDPPEIAAIRRIIDENYKAGYAFHQQALKNDLRLRKWVLRPDYLGENGKLPR